MNFQSSFKQILNDKLNSTETNECFYSANTTTNVDLEPSHLAYLMGNIGRMRTSVPRGHYPQPKIRPARPPHNLSDLQRQSYSFLKSWIHDFSESFSEKELKGAFRRAALMLHPDQGGNVQLFMELRKHVEILNGALEKLSKSE